MCKLKNVENFDTYGTFDYEQNSIYPKFNNKIDVILKIKMAAFLFEIFSLKKIIPQSIESIITPMLRVGKKIALSSLPESVVLSKLQHPKQAPMQDAVMRFLLLNGAGPCDFEHEAKSRESPAAKINAKNKNMDFSSE